MPLIIMSIAAPIVTVYLGAKIGLLPYESPAGGLCFVIAIALSIIFAREAPQGLRFLVWFTTAALAAEVGKILFSL